MTSLLSSKLLSGLQASLNIGASSKENVINVTARSLRSVLSDPAMTQEDKKTAKRLLLRVIRRAKARVPHFKQLRESYASQVDSKQPVLNSGIEEKKGNVVCHDAGTASPVGAHAQVLSSPKRAQAARAEIHRGTVVP